MLLPDERLDGREATKLLLPDERLDGREGLLFGREERWGCSVSLVFSFLVAGVEWSAYIHTLPKFSKFPYVVPQDWGLITGWFLLFSRERYGY